MSFIQSLKKVFRTIMKPIDIIFEENSRLCKVRRDYRNTHFRDGRIAYHDEKKLPRY